MHIYDISRELLETPPYPGDDAPSLKRIRSMDSGAPYNLSRLETSVHAATHVDAPLHFIRNGRDVSSIALDVFYGECVVLSAPNIVLDSVYFMRLPFAPRILLRGETELSDSAIGYLYNRGAVLLGTDQRSIGKSDDESGTHTALLGYGVSILENLDLRNVPDGRYLISAAPIKIARAEGAPCRAFLIAR